MWVLNGRGPKLEKLTQGEAGQFHDGNCYLVLLSYNDANDHKRQKFIGSLFFLFCFCFVFLFSSLLLFPLLLIYFIAYFWEGVNANGRTRWPEFLLGLLSFPL